MRPCAHSPADYPLCTFQAVHPKNRPYYIYDATISYPTGNDSIPTWVAILVPFIMLMISITICEFILLKNVRPYEPSVRANRGREELLPLSKLLIQL